MMFAIRGLDCAHAGSASVAPVAAPRARKSRLDKVMDGSCVKMKKAVKDAESLRMGSILGACVARNCQTPVKAVQ